VTIVFTQQDGNKVKNGSVVGGHQNNGSGTQNNVNGPQYNFNVTKGLNYELFKLYEKIKVDGIGDPSSNFSDKLQHYLSAQTDIDIRSLDDKLKDSGRKDLVILASMLKENAAKSIMKRQTSKTAQRIYVILLDQLHYDFMLKVTPLIESEKEREEVDNKIHEVINEIFDLLGENVLEFTVKDLLGLLFFLGGNCHVRWDKC
jgi:hypothetical protein